MASSEDLRRKIERLMNGELGEILKPVATMVSLSGKAIAERTIKERGFGAEYAETKLPAYFQKGKGLNKRAEKLITDTAAEDGGGYLSWREVRQKAGLQIDYVDLSYSNEMWRGMAPRPPEIIRNQVIAALAHNNADGQDKMNWNYDRYGDFIQKVLEGENREAMADVAMQESAKIIDNYLKP